MPIYEYRCRDCGQVFDRAERLAEHGHDHLVCPRCKGQHVDQVLTSFVAKTARKS